MAELILGHFYIRLDSFEYEEVKINSGWLRELIPSH